MNRAPLIFLGIFFALAFSWTGIILTNQIAYGKLTPVVDQTDGKAYPEGRSGLAAQGKLVYQDLGCLYCHSQQVRRPGYGADDLRGWGERQSVARDYIREGRVLLGTMRTGPDLRNIGARQTSTEWHYLHLYDPQITSAGSNMPPHKFLFEKRKIIGEPSPKALRLPAPHTPEPGYEVVPSARAEALVAYMLSLKDTYNYPEESQRVYVPPAPQAEGAAKVEGHK
jgi:cytochrome c oxidase cbb3-type subunit II